MAIFRDFDFFVTKTILHTQKKKGVYILILRTNSPSLMGIWDGVLYDPCELEWIDSKHS